MGASFEQQLLEAYNSISDIEKTEIQNLAKITEEAILTLLNNSKNDNTFRKNVLADPIGELERAGHGIVFVGKENRLLIEETIRDTIRFTDDMSLSINDRSYLRCKGIVTVVVEGFPRRPPSELWIAIVAISSVDIIVTGRFIADIIGMTCLAVGDYVCGLNGNC